MKPNFALSLSFEGIGLMHRAFPGWHMVDEVSLDNADLATALGELRDKANRLDPSGLRTKLVIPNDQIRYLQFDTEGLGADEIGDAVRRELAKATPYAVDDLAYDWSISAGQVHIAAVTRETLSEAEAFAVEHRFNPLCFVGIPDARDFVGEPWFGQTGTANELLAEGGHVERDTAAIRIIGSAPVPAPTDTADPVLEVEDPTPVVDDTDATPSDPETPAIASQKIATDDAETQDTPAVEPPLNIDASDSDDVPSDGGSDPSIEPAPDTTAEPGETPEPDPAPTAVAFSSIRARRDDVPEVTPRLSGATRKTETPPSTEVSKAATTATDRREPSLTSATPNVPETVEEVTGRPSDALSSDAAARIGASLRPTESDRLANAAPDDVPAEPTLTVQDIAAEPEPTPTPTPTPENDRLRNDTTATNPETSRAPSFFTRRQAVLKRGRAGAGAPVTASAAATREQEKQRMTVFGAREPARVGGKPRFLGVILTAVLLIFLVGVAAWASIFLDDGLARVLRDGPDDTPQIAATPDADVDVADTEPEETANQTVIAALPGVTADVDDVPRTLLPEVNPAELTAEEARARYAVTGIWQRAPDAPSVPEGRTLDDFYLTSIDPKVLEQDAVALPDAAALLRDTRPDTPGDPPAPDTVFQLDQRGLVRATPDGALTPDGVRIFAGKPAPLPPQRPASEDPATVVPETAEPGLDPDLARLAAIRPNPRPTDLSEQNERSTLGGRTRTELAALRPKLRPQSAQQLAEQAAAASTASVTPDASPDPDAVQAALAAAVQTPDPFAGATAQAVATSIKPRNRPRNFERTVQRSQQAQVQTAAVAVPRSQRVSPSVPTATSVARAATEKNALKLRRVNLIGVYGSPSDRRALVRLANGRYKKVKIGDRLDGGRVAAIGDSELCYVKSGRSVTLKMPRG